jgi:hypothetical protein
MRFRWVALLTLWTFLSGPMLALPVKAARSSHGPAPSAKTTTPASQARSR